MNLLLDPHALLWHFLNDRKLSPLARTAIADPANQVLVSAAAHWEIAIKISTGKYSLTLSFSDFVQQSVSTMAFKSWRSRQFIPTN